MAIQRTLISMANENGLVWDNSDVVLAKSSKPSKPSMFAKIVQVFKGIKKTLRE